MLKTVALLPHQFILIMQSFMAAVDFIHSDTTESATKTVPGLCFTITDSRDALTKSATSRSSFHSTIQETGQFASSARTSIMIMKTN